MFIPMQTRTYLKLKKREREREREREKERERERKVAKRKIHAQPRKESPNRLSRYCCGL